MTKDENIIDEDIDVEIERNRNKPEPFDNPVPDNYLGHIVAQGEGLKIGRTEDSVFAIIQPGERDNVEVGDYIRVPYYRPDHDKEETDVQRQLLASVKSLSYSAQIDDGRFTTADTFGAEHYRYIAELSTIAEIELSEDSEFLGNFVSKPPRPTVKIDSVSNNKFLRSGLDVPENGIYVGDISVNGERVPSKKDPLEYYLYNPNYSDDTSEEGEPTIFRHVLVAGSTGTGKTHTSKNILRQFAKCKEYLIDVPAEIKEKQNVGNTRAKQLNITVIDPEDEYTGLGEDPNDMEEAKRIADNRTGIEYGGLGKRTDFEIFAPVTSESNTKQLNTGSNQVTDISIPFEIVEDHPNILMPDNPQGPTKDLIHTVLNRYFSSHKNDGTYQDFRQWFVNTAKPDLRSDDSEYNDSIVDAAARRLIDRSEYRSVFDQTSNSLTGEDTIRDIFASNKVSVITTGHLRGDAQNLVVQAISSYIIENKISSNPESTQIKGTPMILALDEAHEYLQRPETTRESYIVNKFRRAARRGRKDKLGLYFISQNPADLDGEIRNQMNTKIYLQLDRKVVNESDVFVPREFKKQIPAFDKGQMVVVQPDVNPVEVSGLETCLVRHS